MHRAHSVVVVGSTIAALACGGSRASRTNEAATPVETESRAQAPVAQVAGDIRALLTDLGADMICSRIEKTFSSLSASGASPEGGPDPAVGVLWIDECSATQVDPTHLRLSLSGNGWRWLSRQKARFGAEFEIDHYARFSVDLSMVVTVDLAYEPSEHILTVWMVPTQPPQVDLTSLGDIKVDEQGLWAEVVGGAASLIGESPSARAEQKVSRKGSRKFERKLAEGISVAVNLCTGRAATKLGTLPQGQMPAIPLDPKGQLQRGSGVAELYRDGLLLFGPYPANTNLVAELALDETDRSVEGSFVCQAGAEQYIDAFIDGQPLPQIEALDKEIVPSPGRDGSSRIELPGGVDCPVVLVTRPAGGSTPVSFRWAVYEPGRGFEPIVSCE